MIILDKIFTREFPLLLNQLWGRAYDSFFDKRLELYPKQIFIMKKGMSTIYRNPNIYTKVNEEHLKLIKENKNYLKDLYNKTLKQFTELEKMWNQEYLEKEELLIFYKKLTKHWLGIFSAVYVPRYTKLFSKEDRELFFNLRAKVDVAADKATDIMLKSLSKLYNIKLEEAYYVSYENLLNDDINIDKLKKSEKNDLYIIDGNIVTKRELDLEKNKVKFDLEREIINSKENINGTIAQKGIARGKVKLLMRRAEISKVEDGDVLVTYMTIPDYIPAMKRAVAFVTDEGGITCHAAIIARELKKPCIIGTKFATQIFKDGDMVEVNADEGIVRKVK